MVIKINSIKDTKNLANKIAKEFKDKGGVVCLSGELGAGKTTFVQFFAASLRIKDKIISPTFVVIKQHQLPSQERMLYHVDLYRLEEMDDIKKLGFEEILDYGKNIVLVEWGEKMKGLLPRSTIFIDIKKTSDNKRIFNVSGTAI